MGQRGLRSKIPLGSLYLRSDRGYVWRYYDVHGKRQERKTGTTDFPEATRIAEIWAAEELAIRARVIVAETPTRGIGITQAAGDYYRSVARSISTRYAYEVARYFDKYLVPFFGSGSTVDEVTSEAAQRFKNHLLEGGIKPTTINKILSTLRKMLVYCAENGNLKNVPTIKNLRKQAEQFGRVLTRYERLRLLVAACRAGFDYLCFVGFGLYCGLRNSEARAVNWEDIDFEAGLIRLRTQKNRSAMPAPLGRMAEILARVPAEERTGRIVCYQDIHTGERRPTKSLRKTWGTIKHNAGIANLRYHDLRHTFVTECYARLSPVLAPVLARHSSREATAMYLHLDRINSMAEAKNLYR